MRSLNVTLPLKEGRYMEVSYAAAFILMLSITLRILAHTERSVKISTTLPLSVNGASCSTDKSFIVPLWTIYSTIWLTKYICLLSKLVLPKQLSFFVRFFLFPFIYPCFFFCLLSNQLSKRLSAFKLQIAFYVPVCFFFFIKRKFYTFKADFGSSFQNTERELLQALTVSCSRIWGIPTYLCRHIGQGILRHLQHNQQAMMICILF